MRWIYIRAFTTFTSALNLLRSVICQIAFIGMSLTLSAMPHTFIETMQVH